MSEVRRRRFDKEFKLEAVRLVVEEGRPVAEVSRGLGRHENLLHVWKRRFKEDISDLFLKKKIFKFFCYYYYFLCYNPVLNQINVCLMQYLRHLYLGANDAGIACVIVGMNV